MTRDILKGTVDWRGFGVINPFTDVGGLVDLADYPRLKRYLEARKEEIAGRHCRAEISRRTGIARLTASRRRLPRSRSCSSQTSRAKPTSCSKKASSTRITISTSSPRDVGFARALQAVLLSGIAGCSLPPIPPRCAAAIFAFKRSTCAASAFRTGRMCPPPCGRELIDAAETQDLAAAIARSFELYGLSQRGMSGAGGKRRQAWRSTCQL